jgi:HlyD family secretion protein
MNSLVKGSGMLLLMLSLSCSNAEKQFDAQGTFEAREVMVSAEVTGRILEFPLHEGDSVAALQSVGKIDDNNLQLQVQQVEASISALQQKTTDVQPQLKLLQDQLEVQQTQLGNLQKELNRAEQLLKKDAATSKQVDDIRYQIESLQKQMVVTQQQMQVQRALNTSQNRAILSEKEPLQKRAAQLNDLAARSSIINPINGTVMATYVEAGEMAVTGKPLYKIADLQEMELRAYLTGDQLSTVKIGQAVKVFVDQGKEDYREYPGTLTWIANKAEFTPKTIQTKEERANLVYAIKVKVKNDGFIKAGMYGEVKL